MKTSANTATQESGPWVSLWQKNERLRALGSWVGQRTQPMPWFTMPVAAFLITRLAIIVGGYLGEIAFVGPDSPNTWHAAPNNILLDIWARWDSGFYLKIVTSGYEYSGQGMANVAFFPVYPLLTNLVMIVVRDPLLAAIIVSNLSLLGALLYLYQLTRLEFKDDATAARTVFYIASFPTAFFFSAIYTESTFLLFSVATMYYARRQLWGMAAVMGILTAATRIVGVSMMGVVMLEWLRVHGWTISASFKAEAWRGLWLGLKSDWASVAMIALIPLGLLSYMLFLYLQFHDPVAFMTVQAAWNRENLGPVAIIGRSLSGLFQQDFWAGKIWWHVVLDLSCFFLAMVMMVIAWFRLGEHYAILIALGMLIPISSSTQSLSRYLLVLFPVFMMLGWYGRHVILDRTIIIFSCVLLGVGTAIFTNWIFIA